jgi:hypothetical protein
MLIVVLTDKDMCFAPQNSELHHLFSAIIKRSSQLFQFIIKDFQIAAICREIRSTPKMR